MFMSCRFPLQPRHVDGVLYVDFYGISTVNKHPSVLLECLHLRHLVIVFHYGFCLLLLKFADS